MRDIIEECEGFSAVGECGSGRGTLVPVLEQRPRVAMPHLEMPDLGGLDVAEIPAGALRDRNRLHDGARQRVEARLRSKSMSWRTSPLPPALRFAPLRGKLFTVACSQEVDVNTDSRASVTSGSCHRTRMVSMMPGSLLITDDCAPSGRRPGK